MPENAPQTAPSTPSSPSSTPPDRDIVFHVGHDELIIGQRYETLSIVNDVFAGLLFLVGSFLFFSDSTMYTATWLFVIGSVSMLLRPTIRLARRLHLKRIHPRGHHESSMDF